MESFASIESIIRSQIYKLCRAKSGQERLEFRIEHPRHTPDELVIRDDTLTYQLIKIEGQFAFYEASVSLYNSQNPPPMGDCILYKATIIVKLTGPQQ